MPIKGITNTGTGFPEIGRIRLGAPKGEGGQIGKDLNYFRVELDPNDDHFAESQAILDQKYGHEPKNLDIFLPFDEVERCWDANYEAYTASQLVALSDGEYFQFLRDPKTGKVLVKNGRDVKTNQPVSCDITQPVGFYDGKADGGKKTVKKPIMLEPYGRLRCMLPALQRLAHLTMVTSSWNNIRQIDAQLHTLHYINQGKLVGVPMILRRRLTKLTIPAEKEGGKPRRVPKWLVSIEAHPDWVKKMIAANAFNRLPAEISGMLPPADENATIDAQFKPIEIGAGEYQPPFGEDDETPESESPAQIATKAPPAPAKKKASQESINKFFNAAYSIAEMTTVDAQTFLKKHGGDYEKSYDALIAEHGDKSK